MRIIKKQGIALTILFGILAVFAAAMCFAYTSSTYGQPLGANTNANQFNYQTCSSGTDFLMQIAPLGCTPAVVRSDLLEQQDVPVYCQIAATQINPLISVAAINSMTITGNYPNTVSGVGFYPAKAALGAQKQLSYPVLDNIGYVVINLKKQANESSMPDFVSGNLTADINYDLQDSLGIGTANLYLPQTDDSSWQEIYPEFGFWNGKGYVKADSISTGQATISVYDSNLAKVSSFTLKQGETSQKNYLSGFNCLAGFSVKLNGVENPDTRGIFQINADTEQASAGENFLNNKCIVRSLQKIGLTQIAQISCTEDSNGFYNNKPFSLIISPQVILSINGQEKPAVLGDYLYSDSKFDYYLGYLGSTKDKPDINSMFAYIFQVPASTNREAKLTDSEINSINDIAKHSMNINNGNPAADAGNGLAKFSISLENFLNGKSLIYLSLSTPAGAVKLVDFSIPADKDIKDSSFSSNYGNAVKDYTKVIDSFSSEKYPDTSLTTLGEQALAREIGLAYSTQQKAELSDLCKQFEQNYPNSLESVSGESVIDICNDFYRISNSESSSAYVLINGKTEQISFEGIYEPSEDDYNAKIIINGPGSNGNPITSEAILTKDRTVKLADIGFRDKGEYIQLDSIGDNITAIRVNLQKKNSKDVLSGSNQLKLNTPETFGSDYTFTLESSHVNKVARISVVPSIGLTGSTANFQFKIGIEKRWNVTLVPDNMKKEIQALDSSMNVLGNISNGLSAFVTAGKTACLGTGGFLLVKNFIEAFSGTSIARQIVMRGAGGWNEICSGQIGSGQGQYSTLDGCFLANSDKIDKDTKTMTDLMTQQDKDLSQFQTTAVNVLGQKDVKFDTAGFSSKVAGELGDCIGTSFTDPSGKTKTDVMTNINAIVQNDKDNEQLKNIELYIKVLCSGSGASDQLQTIAKNSLYSTLTDLQTANSQEVAAKSFLDNLGLSDGQGGVGALDDVKKRIPVTGNLETFDEFYRNNQIKKFSPTANYGNIGADYVYPYKDTTSAKQYLFVLDNDYAVVQTFEIDAGQLKTLDKEPNPFAVGFEKVDAGSYQNAYKSPKIQFYDTEPYKGMPALVPFDINNGWYAETKPTLPVGGNLKAYDDSGRVSSFYLCNVGQNRIEENMGGDDKCQQVNLETGQAYDSFAGLTSSETTKLVNCAVSAINQASSQYSSGTVNINTACGGKVSIQTGAPAADIPDVQCQDFMSPTDCAILFNVCDPFVCPSSRCDLGGAYPVKDVVQSGILGSIVLCSKNFIAFGGTDVLPVCVTGIEAGIDAFVSVEKDYRDCLQNALDTGQIRGMCDEVHSLYLCDFFWKQAIPLAKLVPGIISSLVGQTKGGGEYLTINSAFSNAEKSANYFVQYYGANAGKAFDTGSIEQYIGDLICPAYSSVVYPSGADLLSSITKPSSPAQFTGRFDETTFTTVTNPPLSEYKVYYHIYAGKDSGAYYQVYLKGGSSSYYQDTSATRMVASGYINAGDYASDTKDFTAPSGYQTMCINVNGQEDCDFGQATTNFAQEYAQESYVASQINNSQITTTADCNSGTIPISSGTELYNQGISRICATDNPGQGTDPYMGTQNQRWVEVGYCDSQNIKCWLDTQSISNAIQIGTIQNQTASAIQDILQQSGNYLSKDDFDQLLSQIKEENPDGQISDTTGNLSKVFYTNEKGEMILTRGDAYASIATQNYNDISGKERESSSANSQQTTQTSSSAAKSYRIDRMGFSLNGGDADYSHDLIKAKTSDSVVLVVDSESNCDRTNYDIYSKDQNVFQKVGSWFTNLFKGNGFNPDANIYSRKSLSDVNSQISNLGKGAYYFIGHCYKNDGAVMSIVSKNLNIQSGTATQLPALEQRLKTFLSVFEKDSSKYKPDGWNALDFEALLIAIAQEESNLGYPQGVYDPTWLMEYGWVKQDDGTYQRMTKYAGYSNQIDNAAQTLQLSLNKNSSEVQDYTQCNDAGRYTTNHGTDPNNDRFLKCLLSVYATGINSDTSQQGAETANTIVQYMIYWQAYLNQQKSSGAKSS